MSRQSNIKWRIQDERELAQVARDFNRKLDRLVQDNPKLAYIYPKFYNDKTKQLESEFTIDTIKSLIYSRTDYNRMLSMLKRFLKEGAEEIIDAPGNDYGSKVTKWEFNEIYKRRDIVNKLRGQRYDRIKDLEMATGEGDLGYTLGERFGMGLASRLSLNPTTAFTPSQSQTDIHFKFASLLKQSSVNYFKEKDKQLKETVIREIKRNFNVADVADVIDAIEKMDNELFVLKFEVHGDGMEMFYPPERGSEEYWAYVSELKRYWLNDLAIPSNDVVTSMMLNM